MAGPRDGSRGDPDAFDPSQLDERSLLRWGSTRIGNLYFSVGNAEEGDPILAVLKSRITEPALALVVEGLESASAHHQNRLHDALALGRRVLAAPDSPPWAIAWAVVAVAAGLSNRDIAERLQLSVRTVEGHIYRACTKLDVADREQLAALLLKAASN